MNLITNATKCGGRTQIFTDPFKFFELLFLQSFFEKYYTSNTTFSFDAFVEYFMQVLTDFYLLQNISILAHYR